MSVLAHPVGADPLIAEAKQRARRRRLFAFGAVLLVAAGAGWLAFRAAPPQGESFDLRGPGQVRSEPGDFSAGDAVDRQPVHDVGSSGGVTWAMSSRGIWLTTDGLHWKTIALAGSRGFINTQGSTVQFVDRRDGWMSVDKLTGALYRHASWVFARTTDGGRTWRASYPPGCPAACEGGSMSFVDAREGFVLVITPGRQPNKLYRTVDGGRSWRLVSRPAIQGPITFTNDREGFAVVPYSNMIIGPYEGAPFASLSRTTDGGRTWSKLRIAGSDSAVTLPVGSFAGRTIITQNGPNVHGGLNLKAGTVWSSEADQRSWAGRPAPTSQDGEVTWFSPGSPNVWSFSTFLNRIYVTTSAGSRWTKLVVRGLPKLDRIQEVDFTSGRVGWAVVHYSGGWTPGSRRPSEGTLFRTTDGGRHWAPVGPAVPKRHRHR